MPTLRLFENPLDDQPTELKPVRCALHRQHIWNETTLLNISPARAKEINRAIANGRKLFTQIDNRTVQVVGAEAYR